MYIIINIIQKKFKVNIFGNKKVNVLMYNGIKILKYYFIFRK